MDLGLEVMRNGRFVRCELALLEDDTSEISAEDRPIGKRNIALRELYPNSQIGTVDKRRKSRKKYRHPRAGWKRRSSTTSSAAELTYPLLGS